MTWYLMFMAPFLALLIAVVAFPIYRRAVWTAGVCRLLARLIPLWFKDRSFRKALWDSIRRRAHGQR